MIDYGLGQTNIDLETGIRYGCISQNSVLQAWADSSEPDYGEPSCPECGGDAHETIPEELHWDGRGSDYACTACECLFDSDEVFGDEPLGYVLDDGEYSAQSCLDSDIIITRAPYYTYAPYCSPCAPGAGDLDSAIRCGWGDLCRHDGESDCCRGRGVKTYCFGHDWFEDGRAPYTVYRVSDGSTVIDS
jgi:hypothetical protein